MELLKIKFKIFLTNWINVVGIFLAVYIGSIVSELSKVQGIKDIAWLLFMALLGIVLYGSIFFIAFILAMFLLDFILMNKNKEHLELKLLIEWVIVSTPAIWLGNSVFYLAAIVFLFSQLLRGLKILKVIGHPLEYSFNVNALKHTMVSFFVKNNYVEYLFNVNTLKYTLIFFSKNTNCLYFCYLLILILIVLFVLV